MEPGAQVSGLRSAADDEGPPSVTSQPSPRKVPKHSTPQETRPRLRRRPPGHVPYRPGRSPVAETPLLVSLSWSPPVALQKLQISAICPEPNPDPWAPEEDPPAPASATRRQRAQARRARGRPPHRGLPGVPNIMGKRRRDPKELVAVMERVKQWEARQLRDIEEATRHELTVEDDCVLGPDQKALCSEAPTASPPSTCLQTPIPWAPPGPALTTSLSAVTL